MRKFYDVLAKGYNSCPVDCHACEDACVSRMKDSLGTRINVIHIPEINFSGVISCVQCSDPRCAEICPTGAIVKSKEDGIVRITEEKCAGCGMCTLACPYGGIYYNSEVQMPFKCDMCTGEDQPACVKACPYGVLEFLQNSRIQSYLRDEDLVSPGTRLCAGCPAELALRFTMRVLGRDTIIFSAPGCITTVVLGFKTKASIRAAAFSCLLPSIASTMTGVYRYYKHIGREVQLLAFAGDAATIDIGFQALSGAAERGENLIYICYDNEGYMNTGIQASGSTPFLAWTNSTPVGGTRHGKDRLSKNLPLIMVEHGVPYVATATIAYMEDFGQKLTKAMGVKDGLSYIHLFSPCPTGWRASPSTAIDISRLAVETNYFPLWEAEKGVIRLTKEIARPKPIEEYTKSVGRFSHLDEDDLQQFQAMVDERFDRIKSLASLS